MKITRRDLKVILLLIGILSAFLVYQFNFKGKLEDIETEENKQKQLEQEISELEQKKSKEGAMNREMKTYEDNIQSVLALFPVKIQYEDSLLYLYDLEHTYDIYFNKYTLVESLESAKVSGNINKTKYDVSLLSATTTAEFKTTYLDMKKFVNNLYHSDGDVRSITSLKMTFNRNSGSLSGKITYVDYAMTGGEREYEAIKVPEFDEIYEEGFVPSTDPDTGKYNGIIGVDNIFGDIIETTEASTEESSSVGR